jgi:hypothetical protein
VFQKNVDSKSTLNVYFKAMTKHANMQAEERSEDAVWCPYFATTLKFSGNVSDV